MFIFNVNKNLNGPNGNVHFLRLLPTRLKYRSRSVEPKNAKAGRSDYPFHTTNRFTLALVLSAIRLGRSLPWNSCDLNCKAALIY
jgi:hypothetical protein